MNYYVSFDIVEANFVSCSAFLNVPDFTIYIYTHTHTCLYVCVVYHNQPDHWQIIHQSELKT